MYRHLLVASLLSACSSSTEDSAGSCTPTVELRALPTGGGLCIAKNLTSTRPLDAATGTMIDLGARAVRSDLLWHRVQPDPDTWDWSIYDEVLEATEARGLELIPMLAYGTAWASSATEDDHYYPPDDPSDFARFAGAAAERYRGRIQRYEIWNEPNAGYRFWKPDVAGDPEAYGTLFLAAEEAIHAVDPEAQVLIGGTFFPEQIIPGTLRFVADLIAAHPTILERADGIAVHPYTLYPPRTAPEIDEGDETPIWEMIAQLRALTGELPIAVTEMGWPSYDPIDEDTQADWLTRGILLAQAEGVTDVCWYTIYDDEDPTNTEEAFGLTRSDGSWKPSGEAFAELATRAATASGVGRVMDLPDGAYGVSYGAAGTAYWGEGEVCGETLTETPLWIDAP